MKTCRSISPKQIKIPYSFGYKEIKIHSYEGLIYCFQNNWMDALEAIESQELYTFLLSELKLDKKAEILKKMLDIKNENENILIQIMEDSKLLYEEELNAFRAEIEKWSSLPKEERLKIQGDRAFHNKRYQQALSHYKKAQQIVFDAKTEHNMGVTYLKLMLFKEAEKAFIKSIEHSDDIRTKLSYIKLLKITNREKEALEYLDIILSISKDNAALVEKGKIYLLTGKFEEAYNSFSEAYSMNGETKTLVLMLISRIEYDTSGEVLAKIQELEGEDYYLLKSLYFEKKGEAQKAIDVLEEGSICLNNNDAINFELSRLYRENKQLIKAIGAISKLSEEFCNRDEVLYEMALIAKKAGNWKDYEEKIVKITSLWKSQIRDRFSK